MCGGVPSGSWAISRSAGLVGLSSRWSITHRRITRTYGDLRHLVPDMHAELPLIDVLNRDEGTLAQ